MTTEAAPALATNRLATHVAAAAYDQLPQPVRDYAKLCLLDSLGCSIGGSQLPAGEMVQSRMGQSEGAAEAILLCTGQRMPLLNAVHINSYLTSVLDFDDFCIAHAGTCAGPTAVSVADCLQASGRDLLTAVVLSYELQLRVARYMWASPERRKVIGVCSTPQVFGPTAAAAFLLGLTEEQVVNAFGLAAVHAPVPCTVNRSIGGNPRPLSWIKGNAGWVSMGGVLAAQLAGQGFRGRLEILDGEAGFWTMASSDQRNFDALTAGLGERFAILDSAFKPYACCRFLHSSVEALENILAQHDIQPEQVKRIVVRSFPFLADLIDYQPQSFVDGQFSLPYVLSQVLLRKPTGYGWWTEESLTDPRALALARKVEFQADETAAAAFRATQELPSTVEVHTGAGTVSAGVPIPAGDPRRPLPPERLESKFLGLVEPVLGAARARRLLQFVEQVESVENVRTALNEVYAQ